MASMFTAYPLLQELLVVLNQDDGECEFFDVDAFLCGIHVDEAESILEEHRSGMLNLEDLNIVPIRPAITFSSSNYTLKLNLDTL